MINVSNIYNQDTHHMDYASISVPQEIYQKWLGTANLIAEVAEVSSGVITRIYDNNLEMFASSNKDNEVFANGIRIPLNAGLFCSQVINSGKQLVVTDATKTNEWSDKAGVGSGFISYLGEPIFWPDGNVFGTICVLDKKAKSYNEMIVNLVKNFKESIEADLKFIIQNMELKQTLNTLFITQNKLVESEKMASFGHLAKGISHVLNTPLETSFTCSSYIESQLKIFIHEIESGSTQKKTLCDFGDDTSKALDLLSINLNRISTITKHFHEISVDDNNKFYKEIPFDKILDDVFNTMDCSIDGIKNFISIDCDNDINISVNPIVFEQIFLNLIENSVFYAFEKDKIGKININIKKIDQNIEIIYTDNGKGFNSESKKHMFDPLYTTSLSHGHLGLGLNLTYNIVNHVLSGEISYHSSPSGGSEFKIVFPIN
jgi:signal transduction histidine kinase